MFGDGWLCTMQDIDNFVEFRWARQSWNLLSLVCIGTKAPLLLLFCFGDTQDTDALHLDVREGERERERESAERERERESERERERERERDI